MAEHQDALKAEGIGIAAISIDGEQDSVSLAQRLGVEFPLLSDPGATVTRQYGVKMQDEDFAVPATFVVRPDRTIAWSYIGEVTPDRPAVDVVREEARKAR
ncbi:MAG: peroxiredoxin family protein [Deltaproteobacteria bacterium]|nr:peroxiredoxin family protein [Deltaproteobacteria bacterium]